MSASRVVLMAVLLGASAALAAPTGGAAQEGRQGPAVDVVAENRANTGAHVFVLQGGHMVPLGFVDAGERETWAIPPAAVEPGEPIRLLADPLDTAEWYESDAISVRQGTEVGFTIESDLERSSVSIGG